MLNQLIPIAREAGKRMLSYRDAAAHRKEGHYNFVTDADVAVQKYLQKELAALLPDSRFYAEEQSNQPLTDQPTFVVDPIDGTTNFMRRRNASAVSVALLVNKAPVLGVVCNPYADEVFSAQAGKGAALNGKTIRVSSFGFENALITMGTSPYDSTLARRTLTAATRFLLEAGDLRRTGSAALDLCDVACGRTDVFFELVLQPWDVAAGSLLVKEAGGRFIYLGHEEPYSDVPSGILAANPKCAEKALSILKECGA